ncbi:hypothetical protein ACFZCL_04355 [Streptomyces sp. NPDC008159]|uniref:hypothetical protein n=1 Tax=Streptomyces sp. NPDC008159 TaxID=3364817 RepID=UPI0036E0D5F2
MTSPARCFSPADMAPRRTRPNPPAQPAPAAAAAPGRQPEPAAAHPAEAYTPRTLTPAEALAPGRIGKRERFRNQFQHGLRRSCMHPHARLVALTLLGYANDKTGLLSPTYRPTVKQLADHTGLLPAQVQVQLQVLTQRGWLYSRPIAADPCAGTTGLCLAVPAGVLEQLRAARAKETAPRGEAPVSATPADEPDTPPTPGSARR